MNVSIIYLIVTKVKMVLGKEEPLHNDLEQNDPRWFLTSVQENSRHVCCGSIVSNSLVMVSAHCVCEQNSITPKPVSNMEVMYGINGSDLAQLSKVELVKVHPKYDGPTSLQYDIALLKVSHAKITAQLCSYFM